jgi:hypothetical protein
MQSISKGTFITGAIPFGGTIRHYLPYAFRSAGPAAKTVDWGEADWKAIAENASALSLLHAAFSEAEMLKEYVLDVN